MSPQTLPNNASLEAQCLGSMLIYREAIVASQEIGFRAEEMYATKHRAILKAIYALWDASTTVDIVTVVEQLRKWGSLAGVGGEPSVSELQSDYATSPDIRAWLIELRALATRRAVIALAQKAAADAYNDTYEGSALLDLQDGAVRLQANAGPSRLVRLGEYLSTAIERIDAYKSGQIQGLTTGLAVLDEILGGLQTGDLVTVAGRPSMGKSALGRCMALAVSKRGVNVLLHTLEMSTQQVVECMACAEAGVDLKRLRTGTYGADGAKKLSDAYSVLHSLPLWIDDEPGVTVSHVRAKAQRVNPGLILIDYVQLMRGQTGGSRQQEIGSITRGLKALARECDSPIVILAQIGRGPEMREDKRPLLSDLREAGDIENDSDVVVFCYRPEYYMGEWTPEKPLDDHFGSIRNRADLIVAKQRMGPTGPVSCTFLRWCAKFVDRSSVDVS